MHLFLPVNLLVIENETFYYQFFLLFFVTWFSPSYFISKKHTQTSREEIIFNWQRNELITCNDSHQNVFVEETCPVILYFGTHCFTYKIQYFPSKRNLLKCNIFCWYCLFRTSYADLQRFATFLLLKLWISCIFLQEMIIQLNVGNRMSIDYYSK